MGLEAKLWASGLGFELRRGWTEKEEKKEKEKFLLCVKA